MLPWRTLLCSRKPRAPSSQGDRRRRLGAAGAALPEPVQGRPPAALRRARMGRAAWPGRGPRKPGACPAAGPGGNHGQASHEA